MSPLVPDIEPYNAKPLQHFHALAIDGHPEEFNEEVSHRHPGGDRAHTHDVTVGPAFKRIARELAP